MLSGRLGGTLHAFRHGRTFKVLRILLLCSIFYENTNFPLYEKCAPVITIRAYDSSLTIIIIIKGHSEKHASSRRRTRKTQNLGPQQRAQEAKEN